jgi:ABC-type multidrug transport system ATPase subunit
MGDARPPTGTDRGLSVDLSGVTLRTDDTTLLEDVTFSVQPGEVVAIVGPPGSGTSWLMKLLLGRCDPDHGSITVGGARPGRASTQRLVRYVPSSEHMYPELTVAETLTFAARLRDAGAW